MFSALLVCLVVITSAARADSFVMPTDGYLYLQQMRGEAAATSVFGVGTSPSDFVPLYTGLPNGPSPNGLVLVGFFSAGTTINFGIFTTFDGTGWAFSNGTDQASLVAFSDIDNSLGLGGSILQQTTANTWIMHLDDALSVGIDDDDNDILMGLRISPTKISTVPEPGAWVLVLTGIGMIRLRRVH
jgi:hypothetical protein